MIHVALQVDCSLATTERNAVCASELGVRFDGKSEGVCKDGRARLELSIVVNNVEVREDADGASHAFVRSESLSEAEPWSGVEAASKLERQHTHLICALHTTLTCGTCTASKS